MGIVTIVFVFTVLFEQFLNVPMTQDGFPLSLVILGVGFIAFVTKALITKSSDLFTMPLSRVAHVSVLAFFLVMIVSSMNSRDLPLSLIQLQRFVYCMAIYFFVLYTVKEEKQLFRVWMAMLAAYLVISMIGITEAYTGKSIYEFLNGKSLFGADVSRSVLKMADVGRIHGPAGDPEFHSGRMFSFLFLSAPIVLMFSSASLKVTGVLFMTLSVSNILGAGFKGAIPAFLLSLIIFVWRIRVKWKWEIIAFSLVLVTATGVLIHLAFPKVPMERLFKAGGKYSERLQLRTNNLLIALNMGLDHPIIGNGPNGFVIRYSEYSRDIASARLKKIAAHSTYAQVFAEFGALGSTVFASIFFLTLMSINSVSATLSGIRGGLAVGIMASISAQMVLMMASNFFLDQNLWLLLGLAGAIERIYGSPTICETPSDKGVGKTVV